MSPGRAADGYPGRGHHLSRGQFEERLLGLISEVKAGGQRHPVHRLEALQTTLGAGAVEGGAVNAGKILKPALAPGDLRVIGATTPEEYQRYIVQDAALERRFQPVWVPRIASGGSVGDAAGRQGGYGDAPRCDDRR